MRSSCHWLDAEARCKRVVTPEGAVHTLAINGKYLWSGRRAGCAAQSVAHPEVWRLVGAVLLVPGVAGADGEVYPANHASGRRFAGGGRDITMAFICRGGGWTAWASWRQSGVIGGKENNGFRTLERTLRPKEPHIAAHAERQHRCTPEFKARYDARTGGEGSLSQGHSGLRSAACPIHRHGQDPARTYPDRRLPKPTPPWRVVCRDLAGTHAHRPVRHIGTSLNVSLEGLAGIRQRYQTT